MFYEIKWQKVSNAYWVKYKTLVDLIFRFINEDKLNFRSIVIDTHKLDHKKYNEDDADLGFYKMYYQLLLHCFGADYHRIDNRFVVYPDQKPGKYTLNTLKNYLNNNIFFKYDNNKSPFVSIEAVDSKKTDMVQLVDILIGAIGYHKNGYHNNPTSSPIKKRFAAYIAGKVGVREFNRDLRFKGKGFTVWNFNLRQ